MSEPFDRALRAAARRGRDAGVCPDAATLAAYADNGLSPAERAQVEAHSADCASCQRHLALLGAVSVERGDPAEPARSWLGRWGWLVPVATAVLVVAVWIRMPERQAAVEVDRDEAARVATREPARLDDRAQMPAAPPARFEAAPGAAAAPTRQPAPGRDQTGTLTRSSEARQKAVVPGPAAPRAPAAAPHAAAPVEDVAAQAESPRDQRLLGQAAAPARAGAAAAPPAPAAPVAETAAAVDALKEEVSSRPGREAELRKSLTDAPGTLTVRASATESYRANGRRIERSADGGTTWREVLADARASIAAAACAPGGPCWFGGADGEVLRRTPDGFARGSVPVRLPIVAIVPAGGGVALVSVQDGRRYRTTDGGATWRPVP